jgi:hypothetical protein
MFLDITKTETFVPGLWIFAKFAYIAILVSMLFHGHPVLLDNQHIVQTSKERIIVILIVHSVLCEDMYDKMVLDRSETMQRISRSTINGLSIHITRDISLIIFTLTYKYNVWNRLCMTSYVLTNTVSLWCVLSIYSLSVEVSLKHNVFRSSRFMRLLIGKHKILHFVLVVLLSYTITSDCVGALYQQFTIYDILIRLFIYSIFVIIRCYTEGIPGDVFLHDTTNISLMSWLIFVPVFILYGVTFFFICICIMMTATPYSLSQSQHITKVNTPHQFVDEESPKLQQSAKSFVVDDEILQKLSACLDSTVSAPFVRPKQPTRSLF